MSEENKYMSFNEFWEQGLLQEINRQFMHPRGLAFEMDFDDGKAINISGIWDERNDSEGIIFSEQMIAENKDYFTRNAKNVQKMLDDKKEHRLENLGYVVQPIDKE